MVFSARFKNPLVCALLVSITSLFYSDLYAQWSAAFLSEARFQPCAAAVGTKILFAGGSKFRPDKVVNTVDIYDDRDGTWTTQSLSQARVDMASATVGNLVFFGGGDDLTNYSDIVDIYDNATNTWTTDKLSVPRGQLCAASVGTKVLFAGGSQVGVTSKSDAVDIYDVSTKKWTTHKLSKGRSKLVAVTVGNKVIIAGGHDARDGLSDIVDIYDNSTGKWTVQVLSEARRDFAAVAVGDKAFFAGGDSQKGDTDIVDIYDSSTDTWSTNRLSAARFDLAAVSYKGKAYFAGGQSRAAAKTSNVVDIYDAASKTWTTSTLSKPRNSIASAAVGSKIYFAGGWISDDEKVTSLINVYDIEYAKDVKPPVIKIEYKNDAIIDSRGQLHVTVHITDESLISSVIINNEEKITGPPKNFFNSDFTFKPGEILVVEATDAGGLASSKDNEIRGKLPASTEKTKRKYYGLLIAVEKYQDAKVESLAEPIKDASRLRDVLLDRYDFDQENMTFLKNPTSDQIDKAFEDIRLKISEEDLLLIFYAGHGYYDPVANIGYWLPSDALENNKARWFRNSALVEDIRAIRCKHTFLVADACFAGQILKTRSAINNANPMYHNMMKLPSRKAMTSGAETTVPDKSVFINYLIKSLQENENLYFDSEELYHQIRQSMKNNSDLSPQYGEIRDTGDEGGAFVFEMKRN